MTPVTGPGSKAYVQGGPFDAGGMPDIVRTPCRTMPCRMSGKAALRNRHLCGASDLLASS